MPTETADYLDLRGKTQYLRMRVPAEFADVEPLNEINRSLKTCDKIHAKAQESVVKDIRRRTRKQHSAEEKIRIVLVGLRGDDNERLARHWTERQWRMPRYAGARGSRRACTTAG